MKKFICCLLVAFACMLSKNDSAAQVIDSMMRIYADEYPQQKVYVHFDKGVYRPGETIWFKAYLFAGFEPSNFTQNFFAELIDNKGLVVQRKVFPIVEASAAGSFDIAPAQLGNFNFRAYTTWMLNSDTAFLFKKEIVIIDKETQAATGLVQQAVEPTVTFFPEGGDLVADLESQVAFKANDPRGKPVLITGMVKNSKGEVVDTLRVRHDGMGSFLITPAAGEVYTAFYKDENNREFTASLPVARPEGLVLHVNNVGTKKVFTVRRSANAGESLSMVHLVGHMGQQVVYRAKVPLRDGGVNSGAIPVDQLPSGILQVSVFNSNWVPLAERVVMVNNNNYKLNATLTTPTVNLTKRGKNVFEVAVQDTLLTNLSVAITDAQLGTTAGENNIYSGLLLSGDLKGYIHNPAYYFNNTADSTLSNLDLVMLTHGWRRYKWDDLAKGRRPFLKFPKDPPLSLIAKVFGVNPSSPIPASETMTVILQAKDSSTQVLNVPKTGPAEFSLPNLMFYDTLKVFYQFNVDRRLSKNTSVLFENGLYKGSRTVKVPAWPILPIDTLTLNRAQYFTEQAYRFGNTNRVNVLQEVFVKTKPKSRVNELDRKYASGLFAGGDAITFDFLNDANNRGYMDIFQYLQGRVAGLQINNSGANVSLVWRGSPTTTFLNEMQVDAQTLSTIAVPDIAYIKVFRPPFFGAMGGGSGGAIAVYTRKGGDQPVEVGKGLDRGLLAGYAATKEFYSPNYSDAAQEVEADFRSTLYWSPFVFTDGSRQNVKLEFYNNDITRAIRVVVEGVNELGKMVRIEKVIQ